MTAALPFLSSAKGRSLILLCLTQFMVIFDFATVTISTATIRDALHFSASAAPWIYSAYGLTYGGFLLLGGRLADLYGRKRILTLGLWIFLVFSIVNCAASSHFVFLAARALKGVGAALICPAALAELNVLFPERRREACGARCLWVVRQRRSLGR